MKRMIYRRWIEDALAGSISQNRVRLIFGARQTGKTVLLNRLLPRDSSRIYNLQDSRLRQRFERDSSAFICN